MDDALGSSPSQAGALVEELGLDAWRQWCRIIANGEPCTFSVAKNIHLYIAYNLMG